MPKIVGTFPIGTTGEEFAVAYWEPDPDRIAQELLQLANRIDDWTEPLTEAKEAFIYSTELHFETESDPYGEPWQALDTKYARAKEAAGYPPDILVRSGDLKKAATSEEAWHITESDIIFDSQTLPSYGAFHQEGSRGWHLAQKFAAGTLTDEETREFSTTGVGPGGNLPQRMFIGADEDTIAEVEGIFIAWLDKNVGEFVDGPIFREVVPITTTNIPAFGGGFMLRGPGGRFVGRSG